MTEVLTYEALKADRDAQQKRDDALAVENAEMRGAIDAAIVVAHQSSGIAGWHLNGDIAGWDEILPELNIETPATDAALAAVKKQAHIDGIEQFIAEMLDRGNDPTNSITESTRADMRRAAMFARTFVELREAK